MDSQQLMDSKRRCLIQNCIGDDEVGNNHCSYEVKFTCCSFYNDPNLSDVTINVNNGKLQFFGHRIILSSRSEYFRTLFTKTSNSQSKMVELTIDEEFESIFESFLKFMYGYPVDICKENMWLYYFMAEEYMVDDLTKACGAYARESLQITKRKRTEGILLEPATWFGTQDVIDIYERFNVEVVKGYAAANIMARLETVTEDTLLNMNKECICAVFTAETTVLSERELFQKATAWLSHSEKRIEYADDVLSLIRYCHFSKPLDIMEAQMNPLVVSSAKLVQLVAAGCHYKFMKKELNPEDFSNLPEFKKRQYTNRRYRKPDMGTSAGTPNKTEAKHKSNSGPIDETQSKPDAKGDMETLFSTPSKVRFRTGTPTSTPPHSSH